MPGDALHDHVQRHQIVSSLQHDDVRKLAGRLHKLLVHGLHRGQVLVHHGFQRAAALLHIPQGAAQDAHVRVRLHEDLDVQQIPQLLALEDQDALHDDHLGGLDLHRLVGAVVDGVVIHGAVDRLAPLQRLQVGDHEIGVEGVGMVVVLQAALREGAILPLVVVVVVYHADVAAEPGRQMLRQSGLAAAGAAGNADKDGVHSACLPAISLSPIIENAAEKSKGRCGLL